jgi:hypothetical protein
MDTLTVAKQKPDDVDKPTGGRKTAPVQIEKELARMAAVIASHDGITQAELLSPVIRGFLRGQYERVQKEIQERIRQMNNEDRKG